MAKAIDLRLAVSTRLFATECDQKSTGRAFSMSTCDISVSFRDTFGSLYARHEFRLTSYRRKAFDSEHSYGFAINAGSATNKTDYNELPIDTVTYIGGNVSTTENLYEVTFAPDETYVIIPFIPIGDVDPEDTELVPLRVVGIDGKYTASTNKYADAEVSIVDNDPFLAPVQTVF